MLAAKLNSNIVTNVIVVDEIPEGHVACPEWVGIGMDINTPEPLQSPTVPESVTRFQALAALMQAGLLVDVESYMALPETDAFVVLAWREAQEFRRNSLIVSGLAQILKLSETQLNDLFCFAGTITG